MNLVLASTSPRRRELLGRLGLTPARVAAPEVDETPLKAERPRDYVLRLALAKAHAVERAADEVILAGDTTVAVGRRVLEKPTDEADLRRMLELLSGRRHTVWSGVCVIDAGGRVRTRVVETTVAFKRLHPSEIDWYIASGEGMGKAGGYAIQGRAEGFVRFLAGSHSNVVGLPLFETRALLMSARLPLG
jgi:septum formation protein